MLMHLGRPLCSASGGAQRVVPAYRWFLPVLVALVLWTAASHGQSPALDEAYSRFTDLYAQGRYEEALPFAERALQLAPIIHDGHRI